jgi:hypothetical protein
MPAAVKGAHDPLSEPQADTRPRLLPRVPSRSREDVAWPPSSSRGLALALLVSRLACGLLALGIKSASGGPPWAAGAVACRQGTRLGPQKLVGWGLGVRPAELRRGDITHERQPRSVTRSRCITGRRQVHRRYPEGRHRRLTTATTEEAQEQPSSNSHIRGPGLARLSRSRRAAGLARRRGKPLIVRPAQASVRDVGFCGLRVRTRACRSAGGCLKCSGRAIRGCSSAAPGPACRYGPQSATCPAAGACTAAYRGGFPTRRTPPNRRRSTPRHRQH